MSGPPPGNTLPVVCAPIIVELDGVLGTLETGAIINAGGTSGPYFTVAGEGLFFNDGTSTDNSGKTLSLQLAYNKSPIINGQSGIALSVGKDFVINDSNNSNYFVVSSVDGSVTINGDLTVIGTATTIETSIIQSDHQLINPASGTTTALVIQPQSGVTPIVDLVTIRNIFGAAPVLRVDLNGNLILGQNLTIAGTINGINIVSLNTEFQEHINGNSFQHIASEILVNPSISIIPEATNVQAALTQLAALIPTNTGLTVTGYEHIQNSASTSWTVNHNGNTTRVTVTVYDSSAEQVIPEQVQIIDNNNVLVTFSSAIAGNALAVLF